MTKTILTLTLSAAIFSACSSTETKPAANSTGAKPAESVSTVNTAGTSDKTAANTTAASATGVAACDEYLAAVEKFVNNQSVPQAVRDSYKQSLEQNRSTWKQAASTAQGKASLESGCKTALDSAKPMLEKYGR